MLENKQVQRSFFQCSLCHIRNPLLTSLVRTSFKMAENWLRPVGSFFCEEGGGGGVAIQRRDGLNVRQGREPLGESGGIPTGNFEN